MYVKLLNGAYNLPPNLALTEQALADADKSTSRIVKKAEAAFRLFGTAVEEFNHYAPAEYLMRHPQLLDGEAVEVVHTLTKFEQADTLVNGCLPQK